MKRLTLNRLALQIDIHTNKGVGQSSTQITGELAKMVAATTPPRKGGGGFDAPRRLCGGMAFTA